MSLRNYNEDRSSDESDNEPESIKITLRSIEKLVASGKLLDVLFQSPKYREKMTDLVLTVMHSEKQSAAIWDGLNRDFIPRGEFRNDPTKNSVQVADWLESIKDSFSGYIASPLLPSEKSILITSASNFWRSTRSKLGAKIIEAIFDASNPLEVPAFKEDRVAHFDSDSGTAAVKKWLSKTEYGLDERTMRRLGLSEASVSPKLQKFTIELCQLAAAAKECARKDWKRKVSGADDDLPTTNAESGAGESGQKRKRDAIDLSSEESGPEEEERLVHVPKKRKNDHTAAKDKENAPENVPKKKSATTSIPLQKMTTRRTVAAKEKASKQKTKK